MKKFTFILLLLPFIFASFNTLANKKDSIISIVSPTSSTVLKSWEAFTCEFVIKNVGTDTVLATDLSKIEIGFVDASNALHVWSKYDIKRKIAPNDTIHYSFKFTIISTVAGQIKLFFGCSNDDNNWVGVIGLYNLTTSGISENAKVLNKIYYSNNNLNIYFDSKVSTSANLLLTNLSGQVIDQRTMNISQGEMQESLNLGTLPKGIYILNMQTPYGTDSKKFFVQ
jgi:hypothetical protein